MMLRVGSRLDQIVSALALFASLTVTASSLFARLDVVLYVGSDNIFCALPYSCPFM